MATMLDPDQDERGKEIAERSTPAAHKTPSQNNIDAGIDQLEAHANDPANATNKQTQGSSGGPTATSGSSSSNSGPLSGGNSPLGGKGNNAGFGASVGKFLGRNKNKLLGGGGLGLMVLGAVFGFLALLPLKLESVIQNIIGDEFGRVNHAVDKRAERLVATYLAQKAGVNLGLNIVTGSPADLLFGNMAKNDFEKTLHDKYGIKMEQGGGPGRIKVTYDGPGAKQEYAGSLEDYLNKDLSAQDSRAFLKQATALYTKSATKFPLILIRRHIRRWMRDAYGVHKWKIFDGKKGKEATQEVDSAVNKASLDSYGERLGKGLSCILGDKPSCPENDKKTTNPNTDRPPTAEGQAAQQAVDDAVTEVTQEAATSTEAITTEKITSKITESLLKKAAVGIPIIGWLDLAARIDDAAWNNVIGKVIADIRGAQYAAIFAIFATADDNQKEGVDHTTNHPVSGDEVNATMLKLQDMEKSADFQRIYLNRAQGQKLDPSKQVTSSTASNFTANYQQAIEPFHSVIFVPYLATIGKVVDVIGGILSKVINLIPGVTEVTTFISKVFMKVFTWIFSPIIADSGPELFSAMDTGGDVTANDFTHYQIGGVPISPQAAAQADRDIAQQNAADLNRQGVLASLTNTDNPQSLGSRLLIAMPSSTGDMLNKTQSYMATMFTNPISYFAPVFNTLSRAFTGSAFAFDPPLVAKEHGVQQYNVTQEMLDGPINKHVLDGTVKTQEDCKDASKNPEEAGNPDGPNSCLLDLTTIQAMNALYTQDDDGGLGQSAAAPTTGGAGTIAAAGCDTAQACAQKILANSKIIFYDARDKADMQKVANGQPVVYCQLNGPLNTTLLQLIQAASQSYSFTIFALASGHAPCDGAFHDKGRAVDIVNVNGTPTDNQTLATPLYKQFAQSMVGLVPAGGGIGQASCIGPLSPAPTRYFDDKCTHVHVDVGASAP